MSLAIDVTNLVAECADQPRRYYEAAEAYAEALGAVKQQKALLEYAEAELRLRIRSDPQQWGVVKVTEGIVSEITATDEKIVEMRAELLTLELTAAKKKALVDAYAQRSSLLKAEVELYVFGVNAPQAEDARPQGARGKMRETVQKQIVSKSKGRKTHDGKATAKQ